jgi:hypothetical protein
VTASQGSAVQQQQQLNVQVVQLPDAPPTSGIKVRTPAEVGSPVTVRIPPGGMCWMAEGIELLSVSAFFSVCIRLLDLPERRQELIQQPPLLGVVGA